MDKQPPTFDGTGMPKKGTFSHLRSSLQQNVTSSTRDRGGLADAITSKQIFSLADVAGLLRRKRDATGAGRERSPFNRAGRVPLRSPSLPTDFAVNGPTLRICASPVSLCAALSAQTAGIPPRHIDRCRCSSCLFGGHAIWREVSGRLPLRRCGTRR